jgi:hypothetical protein
MKLRPLILKNTLESHKKRNLKTSMLFTVALAFLVFGGSSLLLVGNMVLGVVRTFMGADLLATSTFSNNYLPEDTLRRFLKNEVSSDSKRIMSYSFRAEDLTEYFDLVFGEGNQFRLSNLIEFPSIKVELYPVDENYIDACLIDYYIPKDGQSDVDFIETRGKDDYVKLLYSNDGTLSYGNDFDIFDVASRNLTDHDSDIASGFLYYPLQQFKILLPEGIKDVLSISGGDSLKLKLSNTNLEIGQIYRLLVRGLPRKVPGFFYMSYKHVREMLQGIMSFRQAFELTYLYARHSVESNWKSYSQYVQGEAKNWSYFLPKKRLLIRLNKDLSKDERESLV